MESLFDNSARYYARDNAGQLIDSFENVFIGDTLIKAADHLADMADLDLEELADLISPERPFDLAAQRPDADGGHSYEFRITPAEDPEDPDNRNYPFNFVLVHAHTTSTSFAAIDPLKKAQLFSQLVTMEDVESDVLELFSASASQAVQESVACTERINTFYTCSLRESTITKTITASYSIGEFEVLSLDFDIDTDIEPDEDAEDIYVNPYVLAETGSSLAVIQPADMQELYEILYYLNLPGGAIATEVTADYIDDDSRNVRES